MPEMIRYLLTFLIMYMCVYVCGYMCIGTGHPETFRKHRSPGAGAAGTCEPPEVGAGTELQSSERAAHALSCCAISGTPKMRIL